MNFKQKAEIIREDRDQALILHLIDIAKYVEKIPRDRVQKIIDSTATELAQMLNKGDTTSVQLVNIFAYRAGTIGHQINAITEDNFVQALKMAKQCDQKRKTNGWKNLLLVGEELETVKDHFSPFFGVPISIKDTIDMGGFASTIGCVQRYYNAKQKDGQIITVLKNAGVIPFVKTNVPQLCMSYQCNNLLWGNTQNPWNRLRTPGGSSGGEAALIASRSSPIGLGGDIGGSLRIPAEFCGLCTLKPTSQRITSGGHTSFSPSIDGQINIRATMGPLARSVDDLSGFLSILMSQSYYTNQTLDAYRKLQPFDAKMFKSVTNKNTNLRIGYYQSFDLFPSSFASRRAVQQVVTILKNKGHTLIPITIPRIEELSKMLVATAVAEGGLEGYEEILDGQPIAKQYHEVRRALQLPRFLHWALIKLLQKLSPRMAFTLGEVKKLSTHQYLCLTNLQRQLKQDFLKMWKKQNLDVIVGPGFGIQAPLIGGSCKISILPTMYANIWNVLDMTVGSLPVTKVRLYQQKYPSEFKDAYERATQQNLKGSEGLPVGVQIISLPYHDEFVLGVMKMIEDQVKFREKYSYPI